VLRAAIESTRQHEAGGRLLVTSPPALLTRWLIRHLPQFTAAHPEIELHMAASLETIDARDAAGVAGPAGIDVRDDETEVFIRFGHGQYEGCRVDRLFAPAYAVVCSPRLLYGMRPLNTPADLRRHNLLHDESIMELLDRPTWAEWLQVAGVTASRPMPGPISATPDWCSRRPSTALAWRWPRKPLVEAEVAAGRLVMPFDIVIRRPQAYYLVVPEAVADRPMVSAFRQWLRSEAAKVAEE
jgi:LysR family glycine cleavage system transcriptional activator